MKGSFSLFLCCFCIVSASAQNFSNKGKDFWLGYGFHVNMGAGVSGTAVNAQDMVLYFTSDKDASVTVEIPGVGYKQTFQVLANQVTATTPLPKTGAQDCRIVDTGYYARGIHVYSNVDIVAYAHIYNASVSGATLLYPTNTLGKDYYAIIYNQVSNASFANSFAFVVAVEEGTTTVEITPGDATKRGTSLAPFQVNLTQGQVYSIMGTTSGSKGTDLTGTRIRTISSNGACKKIAVFCGSGKMSIGTNQSGSADNLFAQCTPSSAWGLKYLTAPTGSQPNNYFRICVNDPKTKVKVNGTEISTALLQRNFFYELKNSTPLSTPGNGIAVPNTTNGVWNLIEADQPITVAQYCTTQGQDGNANTSGDPEMIYLSPVEQTINNITLNSTPFNKILVHYINVIIKKGGVPSFKLDGVSKSTSFIQHPQDPNYSYAIFSVNSGSHNLYSDTGYNAIAYGFGSAESYGYNAGTNIKDLYAPIFQNPYSRLDFAATCVGSKFQFSVPLSYIPTSLTWDFGGSNKLSPNTNIGPLTPVPDSTPIINGKQLYFFSPANGPTPKDFIYTSPGNDTIRLFATNPSPDGCSSSNAEYVIPVTVNPVPKANFTYPSIYCLGKPIQFTDTSTDLVNSTVVNGLWNWGDGTTDSLKNPAHIFTKEGTFNVRYRPITDFGCVGDTTIPFIITGSPVAKFDMRDSTCINQSLTFKDQSTISSGNITKWRWDYGDGRTDVQTAGADRVIAYTATGNYSVQLIVENESGCLSEAFSRTITIRPLPKPNFNLPIVCLPDGIARFFDSTTIADGSGNFKYKWDFGDGTGIDSIANPIYQYKQTGPFTIRLQVRTPYGCIDSTQKIISSIYPQAKAAFSFSAENCLRDSSYFTDKSDGKGSSIQKWNWSWGDGGLDTIPNPVHLYASAGTYPVKLFTITDKGCSSDTISSPIVINPLPSANYSVVSTSCALRAVVFSNTSIANAGTINNWWWDFGDGVTENKSVPDTFNHIFSPWGNYTIQLQVTSSKGCKSDTLKRVQKINPLPEVGFILPEICLADGAADLIDTTKIADNKLSGLSFRWRIEKGKFTNAQPVFVNNLAQNARVLVNKSDKYLTTLLVTSADGCKDSLSNELTVNGSTPKASFDLVAK
ncbi:MAG: PKD domain-containing protein [Sediminibacterium sp.]|nr:PKD domain-containing protein [Sediminibacterium sp.]